MQPAIMRVENVSRAFQGLLAVEECTLTIESGQIFGVIGPNGSGKSTLFNIISGLLKPSTGRVLFEDKPITGLKPYELARLGIGRTFQLPRVFGELSVAQNIVIPMKLCNPDSDRTIESYLDTFSLSGLAEMPAKRLSHGQQKLLEFAMAAAAKPKILLLDEPTAGVNPHFIAKMEDMIRGFRAEGATVMIVEHTLRVVDSLCDRVMVLDQGRVVAEGTPKELKSMPDVRKAYYLM
jgi:ABC-type branched-subunit amino acid transport system ATPase component